MDPSSDTICPLCSMPVGEAQPFRFPSVESEHPLVQKLSAQQVHPACLRAWDDLPDFVDAWNRDGDRVLDGRSRLSIKAGMPRFAGPGSALVDGLIRFVRNMGT